MNDSYTLSCPTIFTSECSSSRPMPCFQGPPTAPTPPLTRRGQELVSVADDQAAGGYWSLGCAMKAGESYDVSFVVRFTPNLPSVFICEPPPMPRRERYYNLKT
jgi:hypothetical protein